METLSISLGFSIGGPKRILAVGWRVAECGWWLVAAAVIKGGCSQPAQKPAPRCARLAFLCLSLPLQASLSVRTAHKKPQAVAWGFLWMEVRSGFEPL